MAVVKYFILLFVLFSTFNIGYNLDCYKCISKVDEACHTEIVTCETGFVSNYYSIPDFSTEPSCVSGKSTHLGEEYKFKNCGDQFQDLGFLVLDNYGDKKGFSYESCDTDLCNGDKYVERVSNIKPNSYTDAAKELVDYGLDSFENDKINSVDSVDYEEDFYSDTWNSSNAFKCNSFVVFVTGAVFLFTTMF